MTFLHFKEADGLRAFASLNMPNTFKFIIDDHNYFMPKILADFLSPAVAQMHLLDPTLNYFLISDVSDQNLDFELFMLLASGRTIEITPENCPFIEIVASKLMNEEIVIIASDYLNKIAPTTIDNAVFRLNQKRNVGILPFCEIDFIAEHFWIINPNYLFQIKLKDLNLILSNPKLKILNEDWLFILILRIIKDKGEEYIEALSYVSFQDLSMNSIQKYFEKSDNNQIDEFIFRSVRERLTIKNENIEYQSHLMASQSEIDYAYQKSKNQKDNNEYSFNSEFFNEYHIYQNQQTFDYLSSLFDNSPTTSTSSFIYDFNNKFNPFEPNPKKPFPDYYSKIRNDNNREKKEEEKRKPLIQDNDDYPFLSMPVNIQYSGKSEQIPVHFTKTDNFYFSSSSSDDEKYNENSQSLLDKIANQVFHNSQKIFDNQDQKEPEKDKKQKEEEKTTNQASFFTSFKNGLLSFFTPSNQVEPENIIPRDEELTSFKPEPIYQNQRNFENNGWPYPPQLNHQIGQSNNNNDDENNENNFAENRNNNNNNDDDDDGTSNFHVPIHDENDGSDRIKIGNNSVGDVLNRNKTTENEKNKSDDDSDMDGYGGFTKEQY